MSDTRALDRAVKWLYEKDGDSSDESPQPKNRARRSRGVPPSAFRHDRKCSVCHHAERDEIDREFLHWRSPERIAKEYGIAHHSSIYRHARATGLFAQRATYLKISLAPIIEQAMVVPANADSVIRAVIACAHINDDGEWVNPPKRVVHQSTKCAAPQSQDLHVALGPSAQQPFHVSSLAVSAQDTGKPQRKLIANRCRVEHDATG